MVVYRLGRVQGSPRRPGLTLVLPFVDYTKRIRTAHNSLPISPTQVTILMKTIKRSLIFFRI